MELLEVLTIGLPFCGFKILAGLSLGGAGGLLLVGLGVVDAAVNAANFAGLLLARRRPLPVCALAFASGSLRGGAPLAKRRDLGASLDVLLSFALVAVMIGFGRLRSMTPAHLAAWNVCVILNVLGAGLGRFGASLRDLSRA
jgi:hypothetical protein